MGKEKRDRLIMYQVGENGELVWPGPRLSFIDDDGAVHFEDGDSSYELNLRVAFSVLLDPRYSENQDDGSRADQVPLDLIECLSPPNDLSPEQREILRHLLMIAVEEMHEYDSPGKTVAALDFFEQHNPNTPSTPTREKAAKLWKDLLHGQLDGFGPEDNHVVLTLCETLITLYPGESVTPSKSEIDRAHARKICAFYQQPIGTKIDPATLPFQLVKLYFLLVQAQRELSNCEAHKHPRLEERSKCPVCDLANFSLKLARDVPSIAKEGDWQTIAQNMVQLGIALETLQAQLEEYTFLVGQDSILKTEKGRAKKHQKYMSREAEQVTLAKELFSMDRNRKKISIEYELRDKLGISLQTARRRLKEAEKQLEKE